jgi:hypothetical protein
MLEDEPRAALFFSDYSLGLIGLRDGPIKFVYELDARRAKLFDLAADPDERRNIAGQEADRARGYERTLRGWSAAQKAELGIKN